MRGRRWAQEIVAALNHDSGDACKLAGFRQKLSRFHEAVVLKIMRLHERRRGQGTCRVQRIEIEADAARAMFGKYPFGVMPGAGGWAVYRGIGIEYAASTRVKWPPTCFGRQYAVDIIAQV